ncbi:MAG: hypothetical protein ACRDS0_39895 [Pseudonocardiaceae bacterium]
MSEAERTGARDLTYSGWHRTANMRRYLPARQAWSLGLIDIDWCEYCRHCSAPLALVETQTSDRAPKPAPVTAALARMAGIPAYSVSIVRGDLEEIALFKVQQIAPALGTAQPMLPNVYAYFLLGFRERHSCTRTGVA